MTTSQYLILLGTIWITPHAPKVYSFIVGAVFVFGGVLA